MITPLVNMYPIFDSLVETIQRMIGNGQTQEEIDHNKLENSWKSLQQVKQALYGANNPSIIDELQGQIVYAISNPKLCN